MEENIIHHDSGSESAFSGFGSSCGSSSSSSYLEALVGSERSSTETESDEDDFIAELTRQMADYMLQEDEIDDEEYPALNSKKSNKETNNKMDYTDHNNHGQKLAMGTCVNSTSAKISNIGFHSSQSFTGDRSQPIQYYQLENQPRVSWGRRGKMITESTQQFHTRKQQQQQDHMQRRGYPHGSSQVGSGMRAVFLGGSGSKNASCGTGVFLPRGANNAPDQGHKKPGCSTVLIPTRVLHALEQHFNNVESLSPISKTSTTHPSQQNGGRDNTKEKSQVRAAMDHQEMELPQEWIY